MKILRLLVSVGICLLAGLIGSVFTTEAIPTWYAALNRPGIAPPNWLFGPVWTTLYIFMGISLFLVWEKSASKEAKIGAAWFAVQLILNTLWSFLFFGLRSPFLGLIEIGFLWLAIVMTAVYFFKVSKPAGWLLIPYLIWVTFASLLNYSFWIINK